MFYNRLLDDLDGLDDCLHVLDPLHNFMRHLLVAYALSDHHFLYGVGLLYVHNLLHRAWDVLDVLHRHLSWDWHLNDLFHDLLDRVGAISVADLLHGHLNFIGLRNLHLVGLRNLSVHVTNNFTGDRAGHRTVNHLGHLVGHLNMLWYLNAVGNLDTTLYNLLNGIRLRHLDDLINGVGFRNVHTFLYWVRARHFLADFNFVGAVHPSLHNLLHGIWYWSVDGLLYGVRHTALHDLFDGIRAWSVNTLLNRVRNLHVLGNLFFHGIGALHDLLTDLLHGNRTVHSSAHFMRYRHIDRTANFVRNGNFNTYRLWHLTSDVADAFDNTVDRNMNDLLNNLLHWDRDTTLTDLFNWVWALNPLNNWAVIGPLHTFRHELLDWIRAWNLYDLLHNVRHRYIHDFVDGVRNRAVVRLGARHIIRLGTVHCTNHFVGNGAINGANVFDLLDNINVACFSRVTASLRLGAARH